LQLLFASAPREIGVRLRKSEFGERLHDLRSGKGLRQEKDIRIDRLHFSDQPFPERKRLGVRIVDAEDAHTLLDPEQHDIAQSSPERFAASSKEIGIDEVLIFLRGVCRVSDRTVGTALQPFWMLGEPWMAR